MLITIVSGAGMSAACAGIPESTIATAAPATARIRLAQPDLEGVDTQDLLALAHIRCA
ncbi:hypothetical protein Misp01_04700 [Microtetraspora sp. NBRC 13810]|nr:hypothetical protein Misp01_04700 [Microtetraspora sp. NBRC 13810]